MREVVLDTETTGLNKKEDRIIEVGCVEIFDSIATGETLFFRVNPQRSIRTGATKVSGITDEDVKNKPPFSYYIDELLDFLKDSPIVAHNASFDIGFLNMELERAGRTTLKNLVVDTLKIARTIYKSQNSLDNLCKRYGVSLKERTVHGALLDAQLLTKVLYFLRYRESATINGISSITDIVKEDNNTIIEQLNYRKRIQISPQDLQLHNSFCQKYNIPFSIPCNT